MKTENEQHSDQLQSITGTFVLAVASGFSVLIFCDRIMSDRTFFPEIWHSTRNFHLLICGGLFLIAAKLLKAAASNASLERKPLFRSCRLITRENCPLCDEAYLVLLRFEEWLPAVETVDVDTSPKLARLFGESVPVVEIDDRVRFRGAVSPELLRRLIDAAKIRQIAEANVEDSKMSEPLSTATPN